MRAVQIIGLDGPGAVTVNEIPEPPGDGTDNIVIDVHAAGVAFPDALLSRGLYQYKPEVPFTPGGEVAGVVRSAPDGAHVRAGDRVLGLTMITDGMAEVVVLPPDRVFALPDNISFEAGAGILFNDLTVHFALRTRGRLMPGETVLVHGAENPGNKMLLPYNQAHQAQLQQKPRRDRYPQQQLQSCAYWQGLLIYNATYNIPIFSQAAQQEF